MFVWPEEITSKFVSAHSDPTDDFVDRLNYVYTVGLFMFLATLTGAKQHFGTAIQCMAPTHFPGTWVEYVQDYCFVSNTYMWVPYVLLLQALLCYLPKFLWNIIIATRDLDMRCVLEEAMELPSITTLSVRRKHLRRVANLAVGYIKYKQMRMSIYDIFQFMEEMLKGNDWKTSGIFPRQIGQLNTHTMQCFLMINALNEKLYLVLWFWLLSLVLIDAVSAINSTLLLLCPYLHYTRVLSLLQASDTYIDANDKRSLLNFTENVLRPDGILLLSFIKDRVNGLIASDLTREIWFIMNRCKRDHYVRAETYDDQNFIGDAPSSPNSRLGGINAFGPVVRKNA
uniref:Innexin n=1 Tax=Loa loa TaxID=7209 RepID=A0A1I7VE57_LOALO